MKNITYTVDANHKYMLMLNRLWLQVFYHNCTYGDYFTSLDQVRDSHTARKFSILGSIGTSFKIKGKYEFLLDIPGMPGFNQWRQSVFPFDAQVTSTAESNGYEPVKLSWRGAFVNGIGLTNSGCSYLDCSAGNNSAWWFPIGCIKYYTIPNTMPLISSIDYQGPEIRLWIRVPASEADGYPLTHYACFNNYLARLKAFIASFLFINS